jgi:hypothetical protein
MNVKNAKGFRMHPITLSFKASILATTVALTACGSGSSGSASEGLTSNALGTSIISVKGGNANYEAGDGGLINITKAYSSAPLNVKVNGLPDTSYELPEVTLNLGSNPAEIMTDTIITNADVSIQTDELYLLENRMYRYNGEVDALQDPVLGKESTIITGLNIASETVLTLDFQVFTGGSNVLYFYNDIQNDGEITMAEDVDAVSVKGLSLFPMNYFGSGSINLAGNVTGQDAGSLEIYANIIQSSGTVNTSGADGDNATQGGEAGDVDMHSTTFSENSGLIIAMSGSSTGASTASTAQIGLTSMRDLVNSGSLDVSAGRGVNGGTFYRGGRVFLGAGNLVLNTGDITADGSDSILNAAEADGGHGGLGGYITISVGSAGTAYAAPRLVNTGALQVNGGDSAYDNYRAGYGGQIDIQIEESELGDTIYSSPILMTVSGDLIAQGGNTTGTTASGQAYAGGGGAIFIDHNSQIISELPTHVVGYIHLDASGGNGLISGNGGEINIYGRSNSDSNAEVYAPAPSIDIATDLMMNGGEVLTSNTLMQTAEAGDGGYADLSTYTSHEYLQQNLTAAFDGNVSANASDVNNGRSGRGGLFAVSSVQQVVISGDISLNGSSDIAVPVDGENDGYNQGGEGGYSWVASRYAGVDYNAEYTANGGAGQLEGGAGGFLVINSATASKVNGSINLMGGNASETEVNAQETYGGNGGLLNIVSNDQRTNLKASYTFTPGTGSNAGINGGAFVDTNCISGICQNSEPF